jgi:unsaturated chondroitin disaccharide hydrolase
VLAACATESTNIAEPTDDGVGDIDPDELENEAGEQTMGACGFAIAEWDHQMLPQRTGRFTLTFYAQANDEHHEPIDAVIGLANGRADAFSDLGPSVRFNAAGKLDVRDGDAYAADVDFAYRSTNHFTDDAIPYRFRMDVDLPARRYSVWVHEEGGPEVALATDYAFRTEQSSLARIDTINAFRDSPNGYGFFCDARVTPRVCASSSATSGWASTGFPSQSGEFYVEVKATPHANNIDAVVGLSRAEASAFSDLAASVRFNPSGYFEARDGSTYRAVVPAPYRAGTTYTIAILANVTTGRYTASVSAPGGLSPIIAEGYAFASEQTGVPALGAVGQQLDSTYGGVTVCDVLQGNFPF